jgi:hypothetical protein
MKLEVGESLALSWLRHVRRCQVVQLNWKVSPYSASEELEGMEGLLGAARAYFDDATDPLDVVKGTKNIAQWIRQAEVDALGLRLRDGKVEKAIAVDIAFHEGGLHYGNSHETASRVAKKLIRTAILLRGPLSLKHAEVVFASPRVQPSTQDALLLALDRVRAFSAAHDLGIDFDVVTGPSFDEKFLAPVLESASSVADTSELFLRSVQLLRLFGRVCEASK